MTSINPLSASLTSGMTAASTMARNGPPTRPDMAKAMAPVADLLGMSTDGFRSAQRQGTTLDNLAAQKGVSHQDLVGAIAQGLKDARPADAPADVDVTAMAESIASGQGPGGPRGIGGHHHHRAQPPEGNQASGLQDLADIIGIDANKLGEGLKQGTSLSDILAANGVSEQTVADRVLTGVTFDTTS